MEYFAGEKKMKYSISGLILFFVALTFAQAPNVTNVRFSQRTDGSLLVDVYYDVLDYDSNPLEIIIEASDDHGETWALPCNTLTGDVGIGIPPGTDKQVVWDFYKDNPNISGDGFRVRVTAHELLSGLLVNTDLTLSENYRCPKGNQYAIKIGAPNVSLDLGGNSISSIVSGGIDFGVSAENVEGITIRNGTIDGFINAVDLINTDHSIVEDLTLRNLEISDNEADLNGIYIFGSEELTVQNVLIEFLPVYHKGGIGAYMSDVTVKNIEVYGGAVGVTFSNVNSSDPADNDRVNGSILNCTFKNQIITGVLISRTTGARISNNFFSNNEMGIKTDPPFFKAVTGLVIEENEIQDGFKGMNLYGITESEIIKNKVKNQNRGILLLPNSACENDQSGPDCFYATANLIKENELINNVVDLYHHEMCIGNTWEGNVYKTKEGSEIPDPP